MNADKLRSENWHGQETGATYLGVDMRVTILVEFPLEHHQNRPRTHSDDLTRFYLKAPRPDLCSRVFFCCPATNPLTCRARMRAGSPLSMLIMS